MALSWLSGSKAPASVDDLIARKRYTQAVELLRAEFKRGRRDPRLRLQLADVLVLAGKGREAVPILLGLADEFALEGFAAKAISVLKKVQKLDPSRREIEARLAGLIKQKQKDVAVSPTAGPRQGFEIGAEEIGLEIGAASSEAETPAETPPAAPETTPPGLEEFEWAAAALAEQPEPASESAPIDVSALGDELLGAIQNVLEDSAPRPPASAGAPAPVVASPLFSDFSEAELVAVIRGLRLLSFDPGDIVLTEGEPGDSLFVLTAGVVRAFVRGPSGRNARVREMEEGAFFGEVSVLTGAPRTATITACSSVELLELDRTSLEEIARAHPGVREVLRRFCERRLGSQEEARARAGPAS